MKVSPALGRLGARVRGGLLGGGHSLVPEPGDSCRVKWQLRPRWLQGGLLFNAVLAAECGVCSSALG